MAQDFYSTFEIGEDDKTISSLDPSGIALAAIQEVYRQVQELQKKNQEIDALKIEISELQTMVNTLANNQKNTPSSNLATAQSK